MLLICYTTKSGHKSYTLCENVKTFETAYPKCSVEYVFNESDDINQKQLKEQMKFNAHCRFYGFTEDDYKRPVMLSSCDTGLLIGFLPKNRKYTCLIHDTTYNRLLKATPDSVKHGFEKYEFRSHFK